MRSPASIGPGLVAQAAVRTEKVATVVSKRDFFIIIIL
jgi:hypothetical protein